MKKIPVLLFVCYCCSTAYFSSAQKSVVETYDRSPYRSNGKDPMISTIYLSTGVHLEYLEQGDKDGIPVILIHGLSDSRHSFEMILPFLPVSLHAYALSLRGHGNSSKPEGGYNPDDFANDIADFMKQLKIRSAVIVGHSMSSTIAQCFAVNYPGLTDGVVLLGAFADYDKPGLVEFGQVIGQLKDPIDSAFVVDFQVSTLGKPIPVEMLQKFIRESRKVPAHVWKGVAAGWDQSNFKYALKQFMKPVLILWGSKDGFCPRADQDALLNVLANSKLVVYEGTGHALHWEEPERVADDLVDFISGITM